MLDPTDSPVQGARDLLARACDTLSMRLAGLLDSKGRIADDIHAIRKLGKSLRGGFSLLRLEKSAAREIQAVSRLLSGPRDATSRARTWHQLAWHGDPQLAAAITGLLDQQTHSASRRPPPETIAWCVSRVTAARQELDALAADSLLRRAHSGLARLQRRLASRCRQLDRRSDDRFHQARKALKAWLGAREFLAAEAVSHEPGLEMLAALLGDENDLATLAQWLDGHGFTRRFAPDLRRTIDAARRRLQRQAIRDAARVAPATRSAGVPPTI